MDKLNNLRKEEKDVLYYLKDDNTIVKKGTEKGFRVILWEMKMCER